MSEAGRLLICATPIGNLGDVSERLRDTLDGADVIYAEDTRRTAKLLSHLGLSTRVRSLFVGNEATRTSELLEDLHEGRIVALVSDAGTPTVSDPGADAVRLALEAGFEVSVVPGPSAVVAAVALAGFGGDRFVFDGFLPRKGPERVRRLERIAAEDRPVVLFASPNRLGDDLRNLSEALGAERGIAVLRELTKRHEETWAGTLAGAVERWGGSQPTKGEVTLVIAPSTVAPHTLEEAIGEALTLVTEGSPPSEAARRTARSTGLSRRAIYEALLERQVRS
jgi:16S rRNA (cytidine1402-2'-O)-methyltransferase